MKKLKGKKIDFCMTFKTGIYTPYSNIPAVRLNSKAWEPNEVP